VIYHVFRSQFYRFKDVHFNNRKSIFKHCKREKERRTNMTYKQRMSLFLVVDSLIAISAVYFGLFLISADTSVFTTTISWSALAIILSHHFFGLRFNLYKKVWEYASVGELLVIFNVVTCSILTASLFQHFVLKNTQFRLLLVTWLLHMLFIGGSRFCWRLVQDHKREDTMNKKRTLIIGAGSAGTMVARQLLKKNDSSLVPVGFIDDDKKKHWLDIYGLPVFGGVKNLEEIVHKENIEQIVIAIPSLSKKELNTIFQECAKTKCETKILPMLEDLVTGKVSMNQVRDVKVEDLLGREAVELDLGSISESITGKTVLVTGAGGSIGSEICRQLTKFYPEKLVLLGHGENSIYNIELELKTFCTSHNIILLPIIADVQDAEKMLEVMNEFRPDVVYHAAAHKHVPLMEQNPKESVKNNVVGTLNVAMAARWSEVKTFVMISSDKAVNPTSVMGATKRLAEMIVQDMNSTSKTEFVAVRFGNVLGSRGSVIPFFKEQIERGGPVTVTHPEMIRYFMTIPEASRLVIQAGALAKGGEIFVLDMGEPVKIVDLARNLIKLSGYSLDEIPIEFTGIRPGEKLYEELLEKDEIHEEQIYPKIYIGKTSQLYMKEIENLLSQLENLSGEEVRLTVLALANKKKVELHPTLVSVPS
jgi:FlaA1/EpsC-like NDP-sugar epimerase